MIDKVPVVIVYDDGKEIECLSVSEAAKYLKLTSQAISVLLRASREGFKVKDKEYNYGNCSN